MRKLADLMEANADYISQLDTIDNGKPLTVAKEDVNALGRPGWLKMRVRRDEVNYRVV